MLRKVRKISSDFCTKSEFVKQIFNFVKKFQVIPVAFFMKNIQKTGVIIAFISLLPSFFAHANPPISIIPITPTTVQNPNSGSTNVEYLVTNQMRNAHTFTIIYNSAFIQNISDDKCKSPFRLQPKASCVLSLNIDRSLLTSLSRGLKVCLTKSPSDDSPSPVMCTRPSESHIMKVTTLDPHFPYGATPVGDVGVSSDYYATPETMLGSWAMIQAVSMDTQESVLPSFLSDQNTVYAVGTAAIGSALGIEGCDTGCNVLNGYCFALKFNDKQSYPYMIFQSVNIGANPNSFDIYMAGGGSGAFPDYCRTFWGTHNHVMWANNIQNSTCEEYFGDYSSINSNYSVTYKGVTYTAKSTLQNACTYASLAKTGFNIQNFSNVSVVLVTCPTSLMQITGVEIPASITTVGNQSIHNLSTLKDSDFAASTIQNLTTTQMQDCKTPSSGYIGNVLVSVPNYEASISADLTAHLLNGAPPSTNYCQDHSGVSFCIWNNGQSSGGGTYCNTDRALCISCGNNSKWCVCNGNILNGCS